MEKIQSNVPVQSGEFIVVQNGEIHIVGWVEDWPDAPKDSSGYRCIEPVGCYLTEEDLKKVAEEGNFVSFESEVKQYVSDVSYEQKDLDEELARGYRTVTFDEFLKNHPDGDYFVLEKTSDKGKPAVGDRIRIVKMRGEPNYDGREGEVTLIDDAGQIHGTWGGCALIEGDLYEILGPEKAAPAAPSTPSSSGYLTIKQILGVISGLAKSQGSYGRLLDEIRDSKREDPKAYEEWAKGMEAKNFADTLEVVLFFEEGKLPKACPKPKYWSVPVVYEMYGSISVEAASAEEAYDKVKAHPEDYGLPDEGFYVDDSFRVADDDRENAVATIKSLSCPDEGSPADSAASGRHTGLTVKATVTFQKWEGDIARFNGEAEFDACDALDSMSDEELAQVERDDPYALDHVYLRAVSFGQIHDYDGPFEVDLDEDNLSDYLEARRKA